MQAIERAVLPLSGRRVTFTTPDFWTLDLGYSHLWVVTLPDSPEEGNPEGHRFAVQFSENGRVIYFRSGGGYFDQWLRAVIREKVARELNGKVTHDSTDKYRAPYIVFHDRWCKTPGRPFDPEPPRDLYDSFHESLFQFFGIQDPDEVNRIVQSSPKGFQ